MSAARAFYDALEHLVPDDPFVALTRAFAAGSGGSPERVLALQEVVDRFPDHAASRNALAYQCWWSGNRACAVEEVKKYVELEPDHPNAHDSYAEIMQFQGFLKEAEKHYTRAAELDPEFAIAYTGLASVRTMQGSADEARRILADAEKRVSSISDRLGLRWAAAASHIYEGNVAAGITALEQIGRLAEEHGVKGQAGAAYRTLAVAEAMFGDAEQVEAHLRRARELGGEIPAYYGWAALAYGFGRCR